MTARLLRWLLLVQALAAIGIGLAAVRWLGMGGASAAALGLGSVVLVRFLICANNFLLSWIYRDRAVAAPLRWPARVRMILREFSATMLHSSWFMPRARALTRLSGNAGVPPVLMIHGYGCNSGYWSHLIARLDALHISHTGVDLEPMFAAIDTYVPAVADAVARLRAATGAPRVTIVAHSMGGLVARAYLRAHGPGAIARVVTLGSPHHGTCLAAFGAGENARQMRWRSPWLELLAVGEGTALRAFVTSLYSRHDNIVAPATSSVLPGARNLAFDGVGHVALGSDAAVLAQLVDEIRHAGRAGMAD
jgi:pimeloyl-ACP methyl ester carboxylesterase